MKDFVAFDLETTGLSDDDEIIEVGIVRVRNGEIKETYSTLIKSKKKISRDISELTGITPNMLDEAPDIGEVTNTIKEFIGDDVIIGHNIGFDIKFIKRYIDFDNRCIDTLKLVKIFYPFSITHSLGNIAKYLGIDVETEHRALDDAITTAMIVLKMNNDLKSLGKKTLFEIQEKLPPSTERDYIKGLINEAGNQEKYNYEIPSDFLSQDNGYNEILLDKDIQEKIYDKIKGSPLYIIEFLNFSELYKIYLPPLLKFIKESNEKFCIVKQDGDDLNEIFQYLKMFSSEKKISIKATFFTNKESYICLRKFEEIMNSSSDIDPFAHASLTFWLPRTKTGNLNEIKNSLKDEYLKLRIDETCNGISCKFYESCYYFKIKDLMNDADIIITNYNNYFRNKISFENLLFLDVEEIEDKATQGFSIIIEFKEIDYILKNVINKIGEEIYRHLKENFIMLGKDIMSNNEKFRNGIIFSEYKDRFITIYELLSMIMEKLNGDLNKREIEKFLNILNHLFIMDYDYVLKVNFTKQDDPLSCVYSFFPVEIWNRISEKLDFIKRGIFISNALTTSCNFDYFKMITGLNKLKKEIAQDSFQIKDEERFKIYLPTFISPHNSDGFNTDVVNILKNLFKGLKIYVMFTSYTNVEKIYELIEKDENVFKHAKYKNLNSILKNSNEYIVLGTIHLFERVQKRFDILIIPKIPFPNMKDEIIRRRQEVLAKYLLDTFKEYLLPSAILRMKKSFSKISRLSFDKCAVIILDRRIFEKDYSGIIVDSFYVAAEKIESGYELKEKLTSFFNVDK